MKTAEALIRDEVELVVRATDFAAFPSLVAQRIAAELAADASEPDSSSVIRAELEREVASRERSWPAFSLELQARLRGVSGQPARELRALAEHLETEVGQRDFQGFSSQVSDHVERLAASDPLDPRISNALRTELEGIAEHALEHAAGTPNLRAAVLSRIDALVERQSPPEAIGRAVRRELEAAAERVDGAFTTSVMGRIEALIEADEPLSEAIRGAIRVELSVEPRAALSERPDGATSASPPPAVTPLAVGSPPLRLLDGAPEARPAASQPVRPQRSYGRWIGAIVAIAAMVTIALVRDAPQNEPQPLAIAPPSGTVSVDDVSFEGTVTVWSDESVAVIWIADS
ncbi:MAG: hypothetical protein HY791_19515 [Deltaproteobacteria bacterium]|nr:hypothetical protein [Deltaproteobacteria bacterium]